MINVLRGYARSYVTNNGGTCMINVLRGYARSFATNNGGLCKTADNKGKGFPFLFPSLIRVGNSIIPVALYCTLLGLFP